MPDLFALINPDLADLLQRVKLDKRFVRGQGSRLYDDSGREYLDFVAAYGALPFGFNPPEIIQALQDTFTRLEPSFVQPSSLVAAGELAEQLLALAGPEFTTVTFANSGTEAVEAAIKMARAATGRLGILSTQGGFHGKTLGSLSATAKPFYQDPFGAPVAGFDSVPYGDLAALEQALGEKPYAAVILEAIQGEGGIILPPAGYLVAAAELVRAHGAIFILDEVQTGLGRTGSLFAFQEAGIIPDVVTLAKALGGGIFPVGAVLAGDRAYSEDFGLRHSSTFAGNTPAARVGIAALKKLADPELLAQVRRVGDYLGRGLKDVQSRFPQVIREVRGRGLMWGVELGVVRASFPGGAGNLIGVMGDQELLAPVVASYLLNVHGVRVAPTLNGGKVLRFEPPLIITEAECDQAVAALADVAEVIANRSTAGLLYHLLHEQVKPPQPLPVVVKDDQRVWPIPTPEEGRFAFLVHPLDPRNYPEFDPALDVLEDSAFEIMAERWNHLIEPFVMGVTEITSLNGSRAYGEFIVVPRTAQQMIDEPEDQVFAVLRQAAQMAKDRGARILGLGAYTSIASRGGLRLREVGIPLTTGNSYTAVSAIEAVLEAARQLGKPAASLKAAVVGATGSIGRATALLLAEQVGELYLIGNPVSAERALGRLEDIRRQIESETGPRNIHVGTDIRAIQHADVIVVATNAVGDLIEPEMLAPGSVVLDMSRPLNTSRRVVRERPDVLVVDGGVIEVPGRPDLGFDFGYPRGLAYACMSETMMLALEQRYQDTSLGANLNFETMNLMRELAQKHGFRLAGLRSFDRPLDPAAWQRVSAALAARTG